MLQLDLFASAASVPAPAVVLAASAPVALAEPVVLAAGPRSAVAAPPAFYFEAVDSSGRCLAIRAVRFLGRASAAAAEAFAAEMGMPSWRVVRADDDSVVLSGSAAA